MSLTSYQTALPRNRGLGLYAKWLAFALIADDERVTLFKRLDFGWLYLLCGLVLTVAAIVLPARQDLEDLTSKKVSITSDFQELEYRVGVYQTFLEDVQVGKSQLTKRLIEMQFNKSPDGASVVIDRSASKTPLAWVAQRAKRNRVLPMEVEQASTLSQFSFGQGRLWLLGFGAFAIFVGLIYSPPDISEQ